MSEASAINLDNAMVRNEFLEALIRLAIAKFNPVMLEKQAASSKKVKVAIPGSSSSFSEADKLTSATADGKGSANGLVQAVTRLIDHHLIPLSQPEARVEGNFFRMNRLYTENVDLLLTSKKVLLRAIFDHYRSISIEPGAGAVGDARLDMEEWLILINESGIYHRYFNVREAKLAMLWSRMKQIDESATAKNMSKAQSLSFLDFLEAIGRCSDLMSPPPPDEIESLGFSGVHDYYTQAISTGYYSPDRDSGAFDAQSFTRPLEAKIEQVLEVMLSNLFVKFGARDEQALIAKLKRRRNKDGTIAVAG